jgi:pimeloyl-ACP methyl ester carboxylesterase
VPHITVPDGLRIYYEAAGDGRPLLLITGAYGTLEAWYEYGWVDALSSDRRLIMLDLRGHGRSEKPHEAAAYGWRKNASDALAVLEAEDARGADVFGQSMGGQVTIAMLHGDVSPLRSLACNGAYPMPEPLGRPIGRLLKRAKMLREEGMPWTLRNDVRSLSLPGEEPSEAYVQRIMSGDAEAYACEAEGQAPMDDQHLPPSGPTMMFFAAEHDPLAVQTCADLPSRFPYARYTYIPGESHFVTRKPAAFLPLLRQFWSTLPD